MGSQTLPALGSPNEGSGGRCKLTGSRPDCFTLCSGGFEICSCATIAKSSWWTGGLRSLAALTSAMNAARPSQLRVAPLGATLWFGSNAPPRGKWWWSSIKVGCEPAVFRCVSLPTKRAVQNPRVMVLDSRSGRGHQEIAPILAGHDGGRAPTIGVHPTPISPRIPECCSGFAERRVAASRPLVASGKERQAIAATCWVRQLCDFSRQWGPHF